MKKFLKLFFLVIFCLFLNLKACFAETYNYIAKDIPQNAIKEEIFAFSYKYKYPVSYVSNNNTEFLIHAPYLTVCYEKAYDTTFNINYISENSFLITFTGVKYAVLDTIGTATGKAIIKNLNKKYPEKIQKINQVEAEELIKQSKKENEEQITKINKLKENAFKNLVFKIDTKKYSAIDPDFAENSKLAQDKTIIYGNKTITFDKDRGKYSVNIGNETVWYQHNDGKIYWIVLSKEENYPKFKYIYNYPQGELTFVAFDTDENNQYLYFLNGSLLKDYYSAVYSEITSTLNYLKTPDVKPNNKESHYSASYMLKFSNKGEILSYKLVKSSGLSEIDKYIEFGIKMTKEIKPIPDKSLKDLDLIFEFDYYTYFK